MATYRNIPRKKLREGFMGDVENNKLNMIGAAFQNQFPWTAEAIAEELGLTIGAFRVWKQKAEKEGKLVKPKIGSLLCIVDPEMKSRLRYSDAYIEKLREARPQKIRQKVQAASLGYAKLKLLIPIYDETIAKFLLKKFKTQPAIEDYIRTHLSEMAKPVLAELDELRKQYEEKVNELLGK